MLRLSLIRLLVPVTLVACGGGGGGSSSSSSSGGGTTNPAPVMSAQTFNGTEDTVLTAQLVATDAGDTLVFSGPLGPSHGVLVTTAAGVITYTPNPDFSGTDSYTARVTDSAGQSTSAIITFVIAGVNDAPIASNDILTVTATDALNVLANDLDPDNDTLVVTITAPPFVGTATVNANRTVNVALPAGFKGFTKFSYRITDAANIAADATALVFVGIEPFKVVTMSPAASSGGTSGIFVNDLMTSRLAHEANITFADLKQDSMVVSRNGRGLAFVYNGPNGAEMRYVDLASPGQSRLIQGPLTGTQSFGFSLISPDGRFVVYEYMPGPPGQQQLNVFDRNGTGQGQRLSLPETEQPLARLGSLNDAGTAIYYPGMTATTTPWVCTVYRADLATRVATPVSVASATQTPAFFWPLPDDASYVDIRFNNGGGMGAYVTSNTNPSGATLLHETLGNPNVYFPAQLSRDGSFFAFTENTSAFGGVRMGISKTSSPGSSRTVGGAGFGSPGIAGIYGMRPDSQAILVDRNSYTGGISGVYEASLAAPETATPVFLGADTNTRFNNAYYSADGAKITYQSFNNLTSEGFVGLTRRGAFGQTTRLTPPGQSAGAYLPDASGNVLLVGIAGNPGAAVLVNVDVPQVLMNVGTSNSSYRGLAVVAR